MWPVLWQIFDQKIFKHSTQASKQEKKYVKQSNHTVTYIQETGHSTETLQNVKTEVPLDWTITSWKIKNHGYQGKQTLLTTTTSSCIISSPLVLASQRK